MKSKIEIGHYLKEGFNKSQATSLAWSDIFEQRQVEVEYKYQGRVDGTVRIDTWCADCKEGRQFVPGTVQLFIRNHKNHKTRTMRIK